MKNLRYVFFAFALLLLPGCGLGTVIGITCALMPEPDHCYQSAAVQDGNASECEKVKGEGFTGQNPPRDKCYLMIAENTDDYSVCKDIQGGFTSYTPNECVLNIVKKNNDIAGCKNLDGEPAIKKCEEDYAAGITSDSLKNINDEVEKAKSEAGADPNDQDKKDKLQKLLAQQAALFEHAPEAAKSQFMKESREAILSGVDDDDVKQSIVKLTLSARDANPGMSLNDQLAKMQEIKDQQETVKNLDDAANTLMDQMKSAASEYATEKIGDAAEAKARQMLADHGSDKLKDGIAQLEGMKEKYDKASEQYNKLNEQYEKLKKVYDEYKEVSGKIDEVNKLVAEGKVTPDRAKVLHGAIYLSKGLEYATDYIPVFGSTASTVTKEVMNATVKFATKRAARTTAIDKCIDDPEHCDPNGITPY